MSIVSQWWHVESQHSVYQRLRQYTLARSSCSSPHPGARFISAIKFAMPLVNERNVALGTDYVRGVSAERTRRAQACGA